MALPVPRVLDIRTSRPGSGLLAHPLPSLLYGSHTQLLSTALPRGQAPAHFHIPANRFLRSKCSRVSPGTLHASGPPGAPWGGSHQLGCFGCCNWSNHHRARMASLVPGSLAQGTKPGTQHLLIEWVSAQPLLASATGARVSPGHSEGFSDLCSLPSPHCLLTPSASAPGLPRQGCSPLWVLASAATPT